MKIKEIPTSFIEIKTAQPMKEIRLFPRIYLFDGDNGCYLLSWTQKKEEGFFACGHS